MTTRYEARGNEAEFEPGSRGRVLRNRLGIVSARRMAEAESRALMVCQEQLVRQFDVDHQFSADDVRRMHGAWLGGIYDWAGEYRTVNLMIGDFMFAAAGRIPQLMHGLERDQLVRLTPCSNMARDDLAEAIAVTHAELILIHPFREGNGRCARLLALLMALQAGLPPLDFSPLSGRGKPRYVAAIHAAMDKNYSPMIALFNRVIERTLAHYPGQ